MLSQPSDPADPPSPTSAEGARKFFGPYRLIRTLSKGATGIVIEAEHRVLHRRVALKTFNPTAFERSGLTVAGLTDQFMREAKVLAAIDDPHVVMLFEAGFARTPGLDLEIPFLALSLAEGGDLERRIRSRIPFTSDAIARLLHDAAVGLHAIHRAGYLHCDLKPCNLLLGKDDAPRWADFSKAQKLATTGSVPRSGTGRYLAPELRGGGSASIATDLFAFGAVIVRTLCGALPQRGGHAAIEHMLAKNGGDPIRDALAAVGLRLMAEDPSDRYPDVRPLGEDLVRIAAGEDSLHVKPNRRRTTLLGGLRRLTE